MDGIIIINKEKNYTSHDVVSMVKKILNVDKVGHTGTLDPNATGVLPILIGKGTKFSKYLINHNKSYEVLLKLGIKTDTADGEGKVIEEKKINYNEFTRQKIEQVFNGFIGVQKQIPPMYSAIKVNGKKLYEYARKGQTIEVKPRIIRIEKMELIEIKKDEILFKVDCSKGTYIRSLCEDIAKKLGTIGYMKELNRQKVGQFELKDSITLEELKVQKEKALITFDKIFKNKESLILKNNQLQKYLNGVKLDFKYYDDDYYLIYDERKNFLGTGIIMGEKLKRDIVL